MGPAAAFPPGLCPAPGCENGEARTQGLPGSIPSNQKLPTRAKGQEEGERSGPHVILLISSIFSCAEQWPRNAPPKPPCPGRRNPSHSGAGKGVTDGPAASTDPQHNLQYGHAKLSFASHTAAPGVGDKGPQSSARAGASSPAPPAAHCPQGCCAHRGWASAELCRGAAPPRSTRTDTDRAAAPAAAPRARGAGAASYRVSHRIHRHLCWAR